MSHSKTRVTYRKLEEKLAKICKARRWPCYVYPTPRSHKKVLAILPRTKGYSLGTIGEWGSESYITGIMSAKELDRLLDGIALVKDLPNRLK